MIRSLLVLALGGCAVESHYRGFSEVPPEPWADALGGGMVSFERPAIEEWTEEDVCSGVNPLDLSLDIMQVPGDGRVLYCHGGGGGGHWTLVESDISSCLPHLQHEGDVFPTTGCDS